MHTIKDRARVWFWALWKIKKTVQQSSHVDCHLNLSACGDPEFCFSHFHLQLECKHIFDHFLQIHKFWQIFCFQSVIFLLINYIDCFGAVIPHFFPLQKQNGIESFLQFYPSNVKVMAFSNFEQNFIKKLLQEIIFSKMVRTTTLH